MNHSHLYRKCQPGQTRRARFLAWFVIAAILALYGWMDKRDSEPQLSVVTYDCAPAMEMDMPIDVGRVQL